MHLDIVGYGCLRLYSTVLVMVCSGMLAPDPFAVTYARAGTIVAKVAQAGNRIHLYLHPSDLYTPRHYLNVARTLMGHGPDSGIVEKALVDCPNMLHATTVNPKIH